MGHNRPYKGQGQDGVLVLRDLSSGEGYAEFNHDEMIMIYVVIYFQIASIVEK